MPACCKPTVTAYDLENKNNDEIEYLLLDDSASNSAVLSKDDSLMDQSMTGPSKLPDALPTSTANCLLLMQAIRSLLQEQCACMDCVIAGLGQEDLVERNYFWIGNISLHDLL